MTSRVSAANSCPKAAARARTCSTVKGLSAP